ncbi:MAG: TonB-dependent receptor [Bacteroidetes bacterium]|nr:TonB-dependent receptor [Bacteroidota bacterium]
MHGNFRFFFNALLCSLLASSFLLAGTTGKISGTVTDDKTGETVVGANIIIAGTTMGAATDFDGRYIIPNISPGTYSLAVSAVGFRKQIIRNVLVNVDFTTTIDVKLSSEAVDMEAVIVTAERPLVRRDLTSTQTSVDAAQIKALPVESVTGILTTQAGIIQDAGGGLHFRGGRSTEVAYTVNGVSVNDPFTNSNSLTIATNAIQELSVVQGTFNAEYGNALSGVVETGLKEGGENYSGQITFYTGDRVSTHKNIFLNVERINPFSHTVTEGSLGGPIPLVKNLTFFLSARYENEKGWLFGKRQFLPFDQPDFSNNTNWKISQSGNNDLVPMNPSSSWTATNRFSYKLSAASRIGYDFIFNENTYQNYSHSFKYAPDGRYNNYGDDVFHGLEYSDLLNEVTPLKIKFAYSRNRYTQYQPKTIEPEENLRRPIGATFYFGGTQNGYYKQVAETYSAKIDLSSILSKQHEMKTGIEVRLPQMYLLTYAILRDTLNFLTPTIPSIYDYKYDTYHRYPKQYSAYIQDKMEFQSIVINAGLRYDYFHSRAEYIVDIYHPEGAKKEAPVKQMLSPRIGVSYPITDRGMIHFSYGHFFQMPQLRRLFENPDFKFNPTISATTFGNANLNPEKTVTYEVGLQQQLSDDLAMNITGFFKDVRDLFAVQTIRISGEKQFSMYVNKDYANIKGFTFSLIKRRTPSEPFGVSVDYTLQTADGNDVSADAFFLDQQSGRESEKVVVPLDWDQEHTLNATLTVGTPNNWQGSIISKLGTGLPYTPYVGDNQVTLKRNAGRKPLQWTVDLSAEKEFSLGSQVLTIFLRVYNLFDRLNELNVFDDTGRSTYTLADKRGEGAVIDQHESVNGVHPMSDYYNNPTLYSAPREVRVGVSLGF